MANMGNAIVTLLILTAQLLSYHPNIHRFIANMGNAIVTAFGTASSSATLPVTINALEEKNKVDSRISR